MILLFTDFGSADLYTGQVKAVLAQRVPGVPVVDLLNDAPDFNVRASAHLLAALAPQLPHGAVFLAVVDPGVGSARGAVVVEADGRWFVGPDNGLLSVVVARAAVCKTWRIRWQPPTLSASFHGRDLFAPIAAEIAAGPFPLDKLESLDKLEVLLNGGEFAEIIYIDHYGNAITGLRAANLPKDASLTIGGQRLSFARVYSEALPGTVFWYENSLGLAELAISAGSVALMLGLEIGQQVEVG